MWHPELRSRVPPLLLAKFPPLQTCLILPSRLGTLLHGSARLTSLTVPRTRALQDAFAKVGALVRNVGGLLQFGKREDLLLEGTSLTVGVSALDEKGLTFLVLDLRRLPRVIVVAVASPVGARMDLPKSHR